MKLKNLSLEVTGIAAYPFTHSEPEPEWLRLKEEEVIPLGMYHFYSSADFFSLDRAPAYLKEREQLLFPYLANIVRGIKDCLVEANSSVLEIEAANSRKYSPTKKERGEQWDEDAPEREMRHLKLLLISVAGALDGFAEVTATLLTSEFPGIKIGRAELRKLREEIKKNNENEASVVTPYRHFAVELGERLNPLLESDGPDKDWLDLLLLLRNKLAHLGNLYTARMTELNGPDGTFYTFLPRRWPFMLENHLEPAHEASTKAERPAASDVLMTSIMHVDLPEYSSTLVARVQSVLDAGFDVLCRAYAVMKDLPCNIAAAEELKRREQSFEFEHFDAD